MKFKILMLCLFSATAFSQNSILQGTSLLDSNRSSNANQNLGGGPAQFCKGNLLLNQEPNPSNGIFNDLDCDFCTNGPVQVLAENFTLTADNSIAEMVIYTGYFPDNLPLTADIWTVTFHEDNAGVPGNILFTETNVPSVRTATGVVLFGVDEYRTVLTLATPVDLLAGVYWLEIHNDSSENTDSVFWEVANADTNSLPGSVFATEYPAVTWNSDATNDFALQICEESYNVDVNVTGLDAANTVTFANGADTLVVSADGTSTLSTLAEGSAYDVSITTQPATVPQSCSIAAGTEMGTIAGADVTIDVVCVNQYALSGTISGLDAANTVDLQNNAANDITVSMDGSFDFGLVDDGSSYIVTVLAQPQAPNQTCLVTGGDNGDGTGTVNGADEDNLVVTCTTNTYFIGGTVSGLLKNSVLVLDNNNTESDIITCNGAFVFDTPLDDLSVYDVTVMMNPDSPLQVCQVTDGNGNIVGTDVTDVMVACEFITSNDFIFSNGYDGPSICIP